MQLPYKAFQRSSVTTWVFIANKNYTSVLCVSEATHNWKLKKTLKTRALTAITRNGISVCNAANPSALRFNYCATIPESTLT